MNKKHWKCINCGQEKTTPWNKTPEGQCPPDKGNGDHNWELQSETDENGNEI